MAKKQQINKKIFWLITSALLSVLFIALAIRFVKVDIMFPMKTYHSKIHNYTIKYPEKFKLEENIDTVYLTINKNSKEKITISGIGTNVDNLDGYLLDIANYNHLKITNKKNMIINDLPAIEVDINGIRYYLLYKNNWVYTLNTNSTSLYGDLDRVAESFRYEP